MSNIKYDIDYNLSAKHEAFPYQHEAYLEIRNTLINLAGRSRGGALFDCLQSFALFVSR